MALTKKMLQAMDISEDKIDQIIEAHRETITGLTTERDELKANVDKYKAEADRLANVEKELVKVQAKADEASVLENRIKTLQSDFDTYKKAVTEKEQKEIKDKAYRMLLKAAGVSEKRFDSIMKVTDLSKVSVSETGEIVDSSACLEQIKSEWSDFIVTETEQGASTATPPDNKGGSAFGSMSLAEKMAYANEHPNNADVQAWLK